MQFNNQKLQTTTKKYKNTINNCKKTTNIQKHVKNYIVATGPMWLWLAVAGAMAVAAAAAVAAVQISGAIAGQKELRKTTLKL